MSARAAPPTTASPTASKAPAALRRPQERRAVALAAPVAVLVVIGLGAVMSSSSVVAIRDGLDQYAIFERQLLFVAIGIAAMIMTTKIPYQAYARWAPLILMVAIGGLVATRLVGTERGGSRSWIEIGAFTVQPAEFAKFAVVTYLAAVLARKEGYLGQFSHVALPVIGSLGVASALVMLQPDLGTTILIVVAAFAVILASAAPVRHVAALGLVSLGGAVFLAKAAPYRWERLTAWFDRTTPDILGAGLQVHQAKLALGSGGLFGVGLGASRARWSFLPNAHTDFIFAIIGEETGLAGSLTVILFFVFFTVVGAVVAMRAPDSFGRLLAIGLVTWLSFQAIVNIGGVVEALPITGVPLPFISVGGSAMIVNLAVVGVLLNIARSGVEPPARRS
ncbi:MAG: putative lipid II flippase FtsW [Actinomycetota bacterium]|nr:putative lipid II flippase FtsW [Actinomycetota bacterium]